MREISLQYLQSIETCCNGARGGNQVSTLHLGTKLSSLSLGLRPTISIQNFRVVTVILQSLTLKA